MTNFSNSTMFIASLIKKGQRISIDSQIKGVRHSQLHPTITVSTIYRCIYFTPSMILRAYLVNLWSKHLDSPAERLFSLSTKTENCLS